jgi:hypothetical protein
VGRAAAPGGGHRLSNRSGELGRHRLCVGALRAPVWVQRGGGGLGRQRSGAWERARRRPPMAHGGGPVDGVVVCSPARNGGGRLNTRQGMGRGPRPLSRRLPRPLLLRYRAGLGRRACLGRGRGQTGEFKASDRATSVGVTRGEDGLQRALERESSGPRRPGRRGWRLRAARARRAPALQSKDVFLHRLGQ